MQKVVLVGGGHTHALVLHALKNKPLQDADITIVNPGQTAPYSGMLPGFIAGHYTRSDLDIDLQKLSEQVGAKRIDGRAVSMDPDRRVVGLEDGQELAFDIASFDVGITSEMDALPGFAAHGVPAKPLANFAFKWDLFRVSQEPKNVVILGGGIAGVEIAMAMAFALRDDRGKMSVTLLDRTQILSNNSPTAQKHLRRALAHNAVDVLENARVKEITPSEVALTNGDRIPANFVVGAAGATPHKWVADTGLRQKDGFIEVTTTLETSLPGVFAVGDCAHMAFAPRPKAGVFAVRQAPVLVENLHRALAGAPLKEYHPQSDYVKLVSLGGKWAFGEKLGWGIAGRVVWSLKDQIDRRFMDQF